MVHNNRPHPDQHIVVHRAPVYDGIVPDRYIIADVSRDFLVGTVNDGPVLYVHLVSYFNIVYIASHNSVEPDTAVVAHHHIAHYGGIFGNVAVLSKDR